jgi:hypothetical protein
MNFNQVDRSAPNWDGYCVCSAGWPRFGKSKALESWLVHLLVEGSVGGEVEELHDSGSVRVKDWTNDRGNKIKIQMKR